MIKSTLCVKKTVIYHLAASILLLSFFCSDAMSRERAVPRGRAARIFPQQDSNNPAERKYAPDRKVDILHIIIDVTPNFKERSVEGTTTIKFAPIAKSLTELRLDAIDLLVSSAASSAKVAGYEVSDKNITITFDPPIEPDAETTVTIKYSAFPKEGLFFRTPQLGYKESDIHLFSQGETHTAPYWYPNYDYPNERSTSEVICRVPADMTVLSNGRLISEEIDKKTGLKAVRWKQEKPHVNYLIALVAGKFEKVEGKHKNIPLAFYTTPSNIQYAQNSFRNTSKIMDFFEKEIGVDYPWNKYYQVTVEDFVAGGMENTSLTILTDRTLSTPDFENIRSGDFLVAHEMAHQWFGDYITCKDWSHIWLNEGFATYYEKLYDGYANGKDQLLYSLYQTARNILANKDEQRPLVHKAYRDAGEQFDYRNYGKGGWVLHMLRCQLGEDLYRKCVKELLVRYGLSSAVTEDFVSIIEQFSGRSWDRFFDQFVRIGRFPELNVSYDWLQKEKLAKITVEQTQKPINNIEIYYFPVKIRFVVNDEPIDKEISIDSKKQDFYFPLTGKPKIVLFDPDYTLLAQVTFKKQRQMLYDQLEDKSNVIGRLQAIEQLKENTDAETIKKLKDALNNDPFYGVRIQAASALNDMNTDEVFEALTQSVNQADARVRQEVIRDIGSIYRPESLEIILKTLKDEKNPAIVSDCIESLGLYQNEKTKDLLTEYLKSDSFRSIYADSAISAIRKLDDVSFTDQLKQAITERQNIFPVSVISSALDALAHISRNEEDKTEAREFITNFVDSKNPKIQQAAIRALGTLGDSKSLAVIESFCSKEPRLPIQWTANSARDKLNKERPFSPAEVAELAKSVEQLKKDSDKMQQQFDDLKKQLTATGQLKESKKTEPNDVNEPLQNDETEPNDDDQP